MANLRRKTILLHSSRIRRRALKRSPQTKVVPGCRARHPETHTGPILQDQRTRRGVKEGRDAVVVGEPFERERELSNARRILFKASLSLVGRGRMSGARSFPGPGVAYWRAWCAGQCPATTSTGGEIRAARAAYSPVRINWLAGPILSTDTLLGLLASRRCQSLSSKICSVPRFNAARMLVAAECLCQSPCSKRVQTDKTLTVAVHSDT